MRRKQLSISLLALVALLAFGVFGVAAQDGTPEAPEDTEPVPLSTEAADAEPDIAATEAVAESGPQIRVSNQIIRHGDNWPGAAMATDADATATDDAAGDDADDSTSDQAEGPADNGDVAQTGDADDTAGPSLVLLVDEVTAEVDGFVVVSQNYLGVPSTVIGFAPVTAGTTSDLEVILNPNPELITQVLWVALHEDTGTIGEYEFTEGADPVVSVDENAVAVSILAAPAIVTDPQANVGEAITVRSAVIDAPGWLVVHADDDGAPGEVLGQAALREGVNLGVSVNVDQEAAGEGVWLMLHYDTGTEGAYEFGEVEGADPPVLLNGSPVLNSVSLVSGVAAPGDEMADVCSVVTAGNNVNRRSGPGTEFGVAGMLTTGASPVEVTGFASDAAGQQWWQLDDSTWVRGDVVVASGPCDAVAEVEFDAGADGADMDAAPVATEAAPGATEVPTG